MYTGALDHVELPPSRAEASRMTGGSAIGKDFGIAGGRSRDSNLVRWTSAQGLLQTGSLWQADPLALMGISSGHLAEGLTMQPAIGYLRVSTPRAEAAWLFSASRGFPEKSKL
jgi:hypothetical protein